jgi:hypothetical protein
MRKVNAMQCETGINIPEPHDALSWPQYPAALQHFPYGQTSVAEHAFPGLTEMHCKGEVVGAGLDVEDAAEVAVPEEEIAWVVTLLPDVTLPA